MNPRLRALAMRGGAWLGRFEDWREGERAVVQQDPIVFEGDLPPSAGREMNQRRLAFVQQPPFITEVEGVTYTPDGMAWIAGRLHRRFSIQEVGPRHVWTSPGKPTKRYARATLLQSQTPRTYGDWMSEHVASLAKASIAEGIVAPLLLPAYWYAKPYVRRDLERIGIAAEPVDATVSIERATVINKTRPGHWWTRDEVVAVRQALAIVPPPVRPGSSIYLSRRGLRGEGPQRTLDNRTVEAAMERAGVAVLQTAQCTQDDYDRAAASAETVFGDHGSAMYNLLRWDTRRIVELFTPDYWESSFLLLADGLGIRDYYLWRIDGETTVDGLATRIERLLAAPIHGA